MAEAFRLSGSKFHTITANPLHNNDPDALFLLRVPEIQHIFFWIGGFILLFSFTGDMALYTKLDALPGEVI